MFSSIAEDQILPKIADFYDGKSVFLTGASGFIGTVILETLLRCCPEINTIYTLLRPKKNVQPEVRKEQIFNKKVFEKIKEENPRLLDKVRLIEGDATLPNLGISQEDAELLINEVSIVFHCAAIVQFTKPLERMRNFEVLVYTSTAFSNCNMADFVMKEEVHRLPFRAEKFIEALKNGDDEKLRELHAQCKPDWPNTYTFSKCLAENLLMDTASDLPYAIIRPAVVMNTWKHPIPGYIEENSGMAALTIGVGKGFVKVLYADPDVKLNLVPADVVANAHVVAACVIGTQRYRSPMVVNCTATEALNVKISEYSKTLTQLCQEFPLPKSFKDYTHLIIVPNKFLYYILTAYHHYIPAFVLDGMLKVLGKKPRIYSMYRFYDTVMGCFNFFLFKHLKMERNNIDILDKLIHPEDKKELSMDFRDSTFLMLSLSIPAVSPFYDWKIDKKTPLERKRIKHERQMLVTGIQWTFLMILCLLIYWMFYLIFQ